MQNVLFGLGVLIIFGLIALWLYFQVIMAAKKSRIEECFQIQCSSGDSEVMTFSGNFDLGETDDSKAKKVADAFQMIQDRRDHNHEIWLQKKAEAIEENAELAPEDLQMQRLSDRRIREAAAAGKGH